MQTTTFYQDVYKSDFKQSLEHLWSPKQQLGATDLLNSIIYPRRQTKALSGEKVQAPSVYL